MIQTEAQMANMNVRVNLSDKIAFEKFCRETGLSITCAINAFVKAVIRTGSMPFTIQVDPFYSEANQARLRRSIEHLNEGKYTEHELIEV